MSQKTILLVDDSQTNLTILKAYLQKEYTILTAETGEQSLELAKKDIPDLILLDVLLPDINGLKICEALKKDPLTKNIPIMFISGKDSISVKKMAFEVGAVDYITKPFSVEEIRVRVRTHLSLKQNQQDLLYQNKELEKIIDSKTAQLRAALTRAEEFAVETIFRLSKAAEHKDLNTAKHIERVSFYSAVIAKEMGFSDEEIKIIINAAPMHDIGKIGIPDAILHKPGPLNQEEREVIQTHSAIGAKILENSSSPTIQMAEIIALRHHERWDGKGYPEGIAGEDIPLIARIVAIADVFDALVSERPYKKPFSIETAKKIILEESGSHFDPQVVDTFFAKFDRIEHINREYQD